MFIQDTNASLIATVDSAVEKDQIVVAPQGHAVLPFKYSKMKTFLEKDGVYDIVFINKSTNKREGLSEKTYGKFVFDRGATR